jgi:hypothetical protein
VASWQTLAQRAARQAGVDPNIFVRLVRQESGGRPGAISPAGAIGYTQLMPGTARGLGVNPRDPWQNMLGGARYLRQQLNTFGNYSDALRAYNAGPGAVKQSHGYAETNAYVHAILGGRSPGTTSSPAPGSTPASGAGGPTAAGPDSTGADVSALLSLLTQSPKSPPSSATLPTPSFTAGPVMPSGYQAPVSSEPAQAKPDINQLLALVRTQGGDQLSGGSGQMTGGGGSGGGTTTTGTTTTGGGGKVTVASGANRAGVNINPAVTNFVSRVAGLYGSPLTIGTGTNHSRLTINGTVSDHWSGNGADIPLTGRSLIRAGQDALIAAGMPAAQARKQTGGGFNIGGWQVIFNTDAPGWGNHTTHLHIGRRTR